MDSYCLSGDNNVVEILAAVQYTIADPFDYIFGATRGEALLRDVVSREIVYALSARPVDVILTYGKKEIEGLVRKRAQERLDTDRTGLLISSVEIKEVRPPASVQSNFDDVINAQIEKRERISRAESYRNEAIPLARAEAGRAIREAEAYRDKVKNSARGESERFLSKLVEYEKASEVTLQRLYLEFVRDNLTHFKKIYLLDKRDGENAARLKILSRE
ncbi:MAG: FtsH protease activity modulator HflK [bacterium]